MELLCGHCGRPLEGLFTGCDIFFKEKERFRSVDVMGCKFCETIVITGMGEWFRYDPDKADAVIENNYVYYKKELF